MKDKNKRHKHGFTLIELLVTMAIASIIILAMGFMLADSQRSYGRMYNRVYGDVVTDSYVTKRAFDAVVRKSSVEAKEPVLGSSNEFVEVYYYENSASAEPDRYAKFCIRGNSLMVDYGTLDATTGSSLAPSFTNILAHSVSDAYFSALGTNVRMILNLYDGRNSTTLACSAVRHSR